jgi:hypothetical protein
VARGIDQPSNEGSLRLSDGKSSPKLGNDLSGDGDSGELPLKRGCGRRSSD